MKKFITLLLLAYTCILAFNLLFKAAPVYAEEEPRPSLLDDIIPKNKEKLKYEEYPPSSYGIDIYVPEGGFGESLKFWKWGDKVKEQMVAVLFSLISIGWTINLGISTFVTSMVGQSMSLNIVEDVGDKLGDVISTAAGFNGSWGTGIYSELIGLLLALLVCWMIWVGYVQRRQSDMLGGFIKALGILVFTLGFFANSSFIIKGLNAFSEQTNKTVLNATQSIAGTKEGHSSGVDAITDLTHSLLIKQPYTLLQFGTTDMKKIGDERIKKMLTTTNTDDRQKLLKDEVEVKKNNTLTLDATFERGALVLLLFLINAPLWVVLLLCSMAMLFYQLMFIIVALMSPVMLLMALVPAWVGTAKKFLAELFRTLLMKVAIGFLLTLMFWVSSILYSATDKYGYLVVAALQILSFLGVWLYRKTIFDAITTTPANAGVARASEAMTNIRDKYHDVKRGSRKIGRTAAVVAAGTAAVSKAGLGKYKQLKENHADRKEKAAEGKRREKEQLQAEKEQNIKQLRKDDNLAVRDKKNDKEQEQIKDEVAASKEDQDLAVRGKYHDIDKQQDEVKRKEEDVKAEVKPLNGKGIETPQSEIPTIPPKPLEGKGITTPQSETPTIPPKPLEDKGITTPQSEIPTIPPKPLEGKGITAPQSGTPQSETPTSPPKPLEGKGIETPQSGTPTSPPKPMESKGIETPQSGTPTSPPKPLEGKGIETPQSGTPTSPPKPMESKGIETPQSGAPTSPPKPLEGRGITTPQSETPTSSSKPIESKPVATPQPSTQVSSPKPMESKPITTPQSETSIIQPKQVDVKPVTAAQPGTSVSEPKQVEVKPISQPQSINTPKTEPHKEGNGIKKVLTDAKAQHDALKNAKSKGTIQPK
ncbi:CD3337/EF1877 family mobilome membrane protein [Bacillus sp. S2(2024)]|uniref:CD3337/EF1877 family mobilome membrane protein n=1 Tax=Bacillus sp. S2(2024) TaxID=3162887 RepID=UPI003D1B3B3D